MSDVIIRPIEIDRDVEGLAAMWNASDLQWPGSWNGGVPTTAEMVREELEEERPLVVFVAEVDGEIVGYCSFFDGHGKTVGEGYLGLLNVHPKYQKHSIGRKLIQATIERSVQQGWTRQTLGTWAANFKAVPTYKKTGHFWEPDSSVNMQNFIPGTLQMPLAKPFFARHNWYDSYVRALVQGEDDERWEGLKVYTQHWEAEGEALTIWIDREARAPVAVETDAVQVAAIASDIKPLAGEPVMLRWRVINKGAAPLNVFLHARGDKGLSIDHVEVFVVPAGQTAERSAEVKVEPSASSSKDDGTAPAVRSLFRLNDTQVELFSGLRVTEPLRLDTAPAQLCSVPGIAKRVNLQLHNERSEPIMATLILTPPEGLALDWTRRLVEVPAKGHLSVPLTLTAAEERVYALPVRVELGDAALKPLDESLSLYAVGPGGLLAQRTGSDVRLETEDVRLTAQARGGRIRFEDKLTGVTLGTLSPTLGPPYFFSDLRSREFELQLSARAGRAVVSMAAEAEYAPGFWLHQELGLASTGLLELRCWLENRSGLAVTRRVRLELGLDVSRATSYLPLQMGLVRGAIGAYPSAWGDTPRDPASYREPWRAWERQGYVVAVGWDGSTNQIDGRWTQTFRSDEVTVQPGERREALRMAVYVAPGDWRAARRVLLNWSGVAPDPVIREPRPVAQARLEPAVLATTQRTVTANLRVDTASNRTTSGQVYLRSVDGLTVTPACVPVNGLKRANPLVLPVGLTLPDDSLGVYTGEAHLQLALDETLSAFNVLRLGTGEGVLVRSDVRADQSVWVVDNGAAEFVVATDYGPSVIAWNVQGENQLCSTFPTPQGFAWRYPSYGGLHLLLYPAGSEGDEGYLHRERVTAQPIERRVADDLVWQGVRLAAQPTHELLKGVAVEVDLLTLGGSNVLQTIVRVRNLWDAEQRVNAGLELYAGLGGAPSDLIQYGQGIARRPGNCSSLSMGQRWGALSHPASGRTLILLSGSDDVMIEDAGQYGRLLRAQRELRLAAQEVCELVSYAVLTDSLEAARGYLALRDL